MTDLLEAMMADSDILLKDLRVDGGASVSDIMMQIQADMTGCSVNRPVNREATALGAAYLAGLATGVWKDTQEIEENRQVDKIFVPSMSAELRNKNIPIGKERLNALEIGKDKMSICGSAA